MPELQRLSRNETPSSDRRQTDLPPFRSSGQWSSSGGRAHLHAKALRRRAPGFSANQNVSERKREPGYPPDGIRNFEWRAVATPPRAHIRSKVSVTKLGSGTYISLFHPISQPSSCTGLLHHGGCQQQPAAAGMGGMDGVLLIVGQRTNHLAQRLVRATRNAGQQDLVRSRPHSRHAPNSVDA